MNENDYSMEGKVVSFLGCLEMSFSFQKIVEEHGGIFSDSIDEHVNLVVMSDSYHIVYRRGVFKPNSNLAYLTSLSNEYGIEVINETQFKRRIGIEEEEETVAFCSHSKSSREFKGHHSNRILTDYTVIDLETTGKYVNDCEIIEVAAVRVRNGQVVDTFESLVHPVKAVDPSIEQITGITNQVLAGAPLCDEVIPEYAAFIGDDVVVGHNIAAFDSCILYDYYTDILGRPFDNEIVDTLHFVRKCSIDPENYKLTTLAQLFGITYDAHRALNDCIANQKVYELLKPSFDIHNVSKPLPSIGEKRVFHVIHNETTIALRELSQLIESILEDDELSDDEIYQLKEWLERHQQLEGNFPFDSIFSKLTDVLEDGVITEDERSSLMELLTMHSDPVKTRSAEDRVDLDGKLVCLTGEFVSGSRNEISERLEQNGAIIAKSVTNKVEYLIVGGIGSTQWACGNYGNKVKKALEMQEKGKSIQIIREDVAVTWLNTINS